MRHENYPMSLWIALATKLKAKLSESEGSSASVAAAEHLNTEDGHGGLGQRWGEAKDRAAKNDFIAPIDYLAITLTCKIPRNRLVTPTTCDAPFFATLAPPPLPCLPLP
ncbi:unnamed protein product, partial [Sphenostylis stenocarpa]